MLVLRAWPALCAINLGRQTPITSTSIYLTCACLSVEIAIKVGTTASTGSGAWSRNDCTGATDGLLLCGRGVGQKMSKITVEIPTYTFQLAVAVAHFLADVIQR